MAQTTLHQRPSSADARLGIYSGADTVTSFGDPAREFDHLRSGCGLLELNWRAKILVTGNDRVRWLNGMVTNNVRDLPLNHGNYNFLLNPQGRILADMYIYNRGEYLLIDTDQSQRETVLKTLDHFIIMDDVELSDSSDTLVSVAVCGPKAVEVLRSAGIDASGLAPLEVRDVVLNNIGLSILRGPQNKPGWHEVWAAAANIEGLQELLAKAGARPVGTDAFEKWRIVHGLPRYGQDIRERDLPQETGQEQALNFSKGCYIGQEIVERIRSRGQVHRKFTGLEFHERLPVPGKIEAEGRVAAEITSVTEVEGKKIGLGYVRRENAAGSGMDLNGLRATIVDPPFPI